MDFAKKKKKKKLPKLVFTDFIWDKSKNLKNSAICFQVEAISIVATRNQTHPLTVSMQ